MAGWGGRSSAPSYTGRVQPPIPHMHRTHTNPWPGPSPSPTSVLEGEREKGREAACAWAWVRARVCAFVCVLGGSGLNPAGVEGADGLGEGVDVEAEEGGDEGQHREHRRHHQRQQRHPKLRQAPRRASFRLAWRRPHNTPPTRTHERTPNHPRARTRNHPRARTHARHPTRTHKHTRYSVRAGARSERSLASCRLAAGADSCELVRKFRKRRE
jgi:hypothetical protein